MAKLGKFWRGFGVLRRKITPKRKDRAAKRGENSKSKENEASESSYDDSRLEIVSQASSSTQCIEENKSQASSSSYQADELQVVATINRKKNSTDKEVEPKYKDYFPVKSIVVLPSVVG